MRRRRSLGVTGDSRRSGIWTNWDPWGGRLCSAGVTHTQGPVKTLFYRRFCDYRRGKKRPEGGLRATAAMEAPQSTPSSPLGACGTWGPPPGVTAVRNRHGRLLGLQNDPNGGWAARQSPTWWPTTWPHPVPPHSPTAPPGRGGPWGRGLWHTRSHSAAWLGLAGPRGRLPARNRPIWAPGAPGQLPPQPL